MTKLSSRVITISVFCALCCCSFFVANRNQIIIFLSHQSVTHSGISISYNKNDDVSCHVKLHSLFPQESKFKKIKIQRANIAIIVSIGIVFQLQISYLLLFYRVHYFQILRIKQKRLLVY